MKYMRGMTPQERFVASYRVDGECWIWIRSRTRKGYGNIHRHRHEPPDLFDYARGSYAHRFAWRLHHGPIPDGMLVCHRCDTPPCVNPAHLFLGTPHDNTQDMVDKGRARGRAFVGEAHGLAKLTEARVRDLRRRAAAGERHEDIAREFGVSKSTVTMANIRQTWRHVA